jgi:hypothetical protein
MWWMIWVGMNHGSIILTSDKLNFKYNLIIRVGGSWKFLVAEADKYMLFLLFCYLENV